MRLGDDRRRSVVIGTVIVAAAVAIAGGVAAQTRQQQQEPAAQRSAGSAAASITLPAQEGMLRIDVDAPKEARVGQSFEYQIKVTNTTKDVMLHDVVVAQSGDGFTIESSQVSQDQKQGQQQGQKPGQQQRRQQREQQNEATGQADNQQQNQAQNQVRRQNQGQAQRQQAGGQAGAAGQNEWTIARLEPGQSRTIQVTGASDSEGQSKVCLLVKSFTPAVCMTTQFTKPDLEIVKKAPEQAGLCEQFEIEYFVKNTGTGTIDAFEIRDDLPEGLRLTSGQSELHYKVDGLKQGDVRKFVAKVTAERAGEFSSRAMAVATDEDGPQARSNSATTVVEAADLAVEIIGPQQGYVGTNLSYTVRVTNHGNAPAAGTNVALHYPQQANIRDGGEVRVSRQKASPTPSNRDGRQPTPLNEANQNQANQNQANQNQQKEMESEQWDFGTLKAGQSKQITFTLRTNQEGVLEPRAVATFRCGEDEDAAAETAIRATAYISTEVLSVPALAIAVSDSVDPVPVNGEVTYKITVVNEGTDEDSNVQVSVELPQEFEFVEGSGATEVQAQQGKLTMQPVETLAPGKQAEWEIRVKAKNPGDINFPITVTSENSRRPTSAEEPTKLFDSSKARSTSSSGRTGSPRTQPRTQPNQ